MTSLNKKHIADAATNASYLVNHWGYGNRILPCTNDAGSCEYLDAVYWMHDVSMLYTFILWAVIGGILIIMVTLRILKPRIGNGGIKSETSQEKASIFYRLWRGAQATLRKRLLPESFVGFFGHVTRLQLLILAVLLAYLLVFSLVGIVYKTWITPVKTNPSLHNTRVGMGGFSDRVGALAYALTPLTIALATRESLLTLITGIPYQSLNFLHRWLGRIIFVQSFLHTLVWTVIEGKLYQPQPTTYREFIKQPYMIWGCVAMMLITFLYVFSLKSVIRLTGHEFFRKSHYVVAGVYIGACWAHWRLLACWMIASLIIFLLDRGIRLLRTGLIHVGYLDGSKGLGFHPAQSAVQYFDDEDGGVVRLDFDHKHSSWTTGQHFFLCFPALTIWQSHPLTVASVPIPGNAIQKHTYIIRCRKGETGRLKTLLSPSSLADKPSVETTSPVILTGPYGAPLISNKCDEGSNLLAVAGGTGVTLALPVVLAATSSSAFRNSAIDFVWIVRRASNLSWIEGELEELKSRAGVEGVDLRIHVYITQETSSSASPTPSSPRPQSLIIDDGAKPSPTMEIAPVVPVGSEKAAASSIADSSIEKEIASGKNFTITYMEHRHPSLQEIVAGFMENRVKAGRTTVVGSGPVGMGRDLRDAVARCNDGRRVMKGEARWDVELEWDDRGS